MIEHPDPATPALYAVPPPGPAPDHREPEPVIISPVLAGETAQLLVMTGHGTYLVDATIAAVMGHGPGWRIVADLSPTRTSFTLVATADRLGSTQRRTQPSNDCAIRTARGPLPTRCSGCHADRGQPCRWNHTPQPRS
jgi:hypothetical protein